MSGWPVEPSVAIPVAIAAAIYLRGWSLLRRRLVRRFAAGHAGLFLAGLATMLLALASPVETLTHRSLAAHMVQHLVLMVVVAPMLWMGAPVAPLFVGLPRSIRGRARRPIGRDARDRATERGCGHPRANSRQVRCG